MTAMANVPAPEDTPMMYGSTRGFLINAWYVAPAIDSPTPTPMVANVLGRRSSNIRISLLVRSSPPLEMAENNADIASMGDSIAVCPTQRDTMAAIMVSMTPKIRMIFDLCFLMPICVLLSPFRIFVRAFFSSGIVTPPSLYQEICEHRDSYHCGHCAYRQFISCEQDPCQQV